MPWNFQLIFAQNEICCDSYVFQETTTNAQIVIKKVIPSDKLIFEKVLNLLTSGHPNIIELNDFSYDGVNYYLFFSYIPTCLIQLVNKPLDKKIVKHFAMQMLCGLYYLHSHGFIHCNINPSNFLIDNDGTIKMRGFYWAKDYCPVKNIVPLTYSPPEIILGGCYTPSSEIWSLGCIFYEMYFGKPLFFAHSSIKTLIKIFKFFGTPSEQELPGITNLMLIYNLPVFQPTGMTCLESADKLFVDLILRMLCIDPTERITAEEACKHEYFKSFD